ncbi:unnamed protein product, partial [marine sediment metagenome]
DILIVGRGGGSLEDLWAFNEEILARAIFDSKIPVISAVGHEIDTTIADLVSDKRASTPTKAGVTAVPDMQEVLGQLAYFQKRLGSVLRAKLELCQENLQTVLASAVFRNPLLPVRYREQQLDEIVTKLVELIKELMVMVVVWFSVLPFLVPALIRGYLANLATRVDSNGICFQSTDYTCGPAAAVTALRKLGLSAHEGELAILSHTSPVAGTLPWCLYTALQNRYSAEGLRCQYRRFDSVGQLKHAGVTLVVVRDTLLSDHCVAVLEVSDRRVTVAD